MAFGTLGDGREGAGEVFLSSFAALHALLQKLKIWRLEEGASRGRRRLVAAFAVLCEYTHAFDAAKELGRQKEVQGRGTTGGASLTMHGCRRRKVRNPNILHELSSKTRLDPHLNFVMAYSPSS